MNSNDKYSNINNNKRRLLINLCIYLYIKIFKILYY